MTQPRVAIVMGSQSDWPTMQRAAQALDALGVAYEARIVSAHRTPDRLVNYAKSAADRGLKAIIAGAGGAAHLPGMVASMTRVPVLGVPVQSAALSGVDSLYSIVQMPGGIPVATFAIGKAGATNAGLFAAALLANTDAGLAAKGADGPDAGLRLLQEPHALLRAAELEQRRRLRHPGHDEAAVPPARPAAADVGLEQDDVDRRLALLQEPRCPHPRVPAAQYHDVRARVLAQRRRLGPGELG